MKIVLLIVHVLLNIFRFIYRVGPISLAVDIKLLCSEISVRDALFNLIGCEGFYKLLRFNLVRP